MKRYLFSYNYDGERWGFEIHARDPEDARARVARMAWASYDGELYMSFPSFVPWWLARSIVYVKSRLFGL